MRHSWLSNGRRESVAEHSWRMALMAMTLHKYLDQPVDLLKTLRLVLVHDLVEINYKDNPAFKKQPDDKEQLERASLAKLLRPLPKDLRTEFSDLWEEYEAKRTNEAKFANALDKLEVLLQHNEADLKHLTRKEYSFNFTHGLIQADYDSFLKEVRQIMNQEFLENYIRNNVDKSLYQFSQ